jgi:cysteine desulfurase/selenocysteine lyase
VSATGGPAGYDVDALRAAEFPWAPAGEQVYLNHASTGPLPASTVRAMNAFNAMRARPWEVGWPEQRATLERGRELCAGLVGASPREIALMGNTTYGINLAAGALPLKEGDVVLTFDGEFPSNIYPWMALARRGVRLRRVPLAGRLPDEEALHRALDLPGVRAVSVSWVGFSTGYAIDVERLGRACRERGLWFVLDAMQGVGARRLDVKRCNVDVLACGAQKWLLGPWGAGFAYVREELARTLEPATVGWLAMQASEDFTRLTDYEYRFFDDARRFEVLTFPVQDVAGMSASLELFSHLGHDAIEAHVLGLGDEIVAWAEATPGMSLVTPAERARRAGIVSVIPPDPAAASARLAARGVAHSLREGAIRLSPHCYNTVAEVRAALAIIEGA